LPLRSLPRSAAGYSSGAPRWPRTQTAVENAQFQAGIPDDGIYGPQTRDHILWYDTFGDCARL
jgi:peptidoglycan hydrolase-like protein with peptidoglycan-binding domain